MSSKTQERISKLQDLLNAIEEAIYAVLAGQSYSLGSRSVTRADLSELRDMRKETEAELEKLERNGTKRRQFKRVVPRL